MDTGLELPRLIKQPFLKSLTVSGVGVREHLVARDKLRPKQGNLKSYKTLMTAQPSREYRSTDHTELH